MRVHLLPQVLEVLGRIRHLWLGSASAWQSQWPASLFLTELGGKRVAKWIAASAWQPETCEIGLYFPPSNLNCSLGKTK